MSRQKLKLTSIIDGLILVLLSAYLILWMVGTPPFYSNDAAVLSPFTALSLFFLSGARLSAKHLEIFPMPLTMAFIGIVIMAQLISLIMHAVLPDTIMESFPTIVLSSPMTSVGLLFFSFYELLVIIRETPKQAFIVDDILLHLALVPGVFSVIGHALDTPAYISWTEDPRVGISLFEMGLMTAYALAATFANPNLYLWSFLEANQRNRILFAVLICNQFVAPVITALFYIGEQRPRDPGFEVYVVVAGVLVTIGFLSFRALGEFRSSKA